MSKSYPCIDGHRRKPDAERDGEKNYGKPCVVCGKGTCGEKWVQVSWMRGDDELIRVCHEHWKVLGTAVLKLIRESGL